MPRRRALRFRHMSADGSQGALSVRLQHWLKRFASVATQEDLNQLELGTSRQTADINHGLVMLAQRVTTLEDTAQLEALQNQLGAFEDKLNGMSSQIDEARGRLEWLSGELVARLDGLDARHAEAREWLTGLDQRVADLSGRVPGISLLRDASGAISQFTDPSFGLVEGFRGMPGGNGNSAGVYLGFEDWFRGTEQTIAERQQVYLAALRDHAPVLDVGCGRGELLEMLAAEGITARGVDSDSAMVARCREKGLDVTETDAIKALSVTEEGSLGAVFAAQLIEHLPYAHLIAFLGAARRALSDDGLMIIETVNPHSPQGLKHFWVDPTHQHPLFPETVLALCHFSGYREAFCWYPQGSGNPDIDRLGQLDYAVIARPG